MPIRRDERTLVTPRNVTQGEFKAEHDSDIPVVCLTRVSISVNNGANHILRDIDFELSPSSFTMILGPSGSGKSMLLRAMLSEASYNGTISISTSRIAYCPQVPWLFASTIRQNICGLAIHTVDEAWYKSVLYACALDDVLLELSHGDNTKVEGQSSNLSGGQKQRLALARALYQRPQLILFDDILSALDIRTEVQVMTRLFRRDGLLSKLGATIVFVTHSTRWKSIADNIITLDGFGNATKHSKLSNFEAEVFSADSNSELVEVLDSSNNPEANRVDNGIIGENGSPVFPPHHGSDTRDYAYYLKSVRWPTILVLFLSAIAQTISLYMSQAVLTWWTADHGSNDGKWLPIYLILAIGNGVLYGCTAWIMFLRLVPESAANLHLILLDVVVNAPYSFFTETDVGTILNRFSQDMTLIESQLPTGVMCALIYCLWTIGSLCLISLGSSWMAITIPVVLITLLCVQRVYLRTSRRLRTIELELRSPIYTHFMETLKGLSIIRVLGWQDQFTSTMIEKVDRSQIPYYLLYCAQRWLQLVLDLIVAALAVAVMTLAVKLRKSTDPGSLGLALNNVLSFNETLAILLQYWTQLEVSLGAISRTREFSKQTPSELKPASPVLLSNAWPRYGGIEICNVSASYNGTNLTLSNITMSIKPGEKIGLCGQSGSGKSSLLSAILRLLEPSSGSIVIDGTNLADICHQNIRERLLTIPQDPFLMQNTVRFNLDPHVQCDDEHMITALSKVSLWQLLEERGGLDATITSNFLSQGQKQLFSLARAIIDKGKREADGNSPVIGGVLLLDEATSNIDITTDSLMQRIIRDEFSTHTILVVAHRLDTILDSDRIAVLDSGKLVEFDCPTALLSRDSAFSVLYNAYDREGL